METRRKGSKSGLSQIIRESRQPCKLSLYYTLIYPYLSYCNIVWSSTYNTHLNRIFILQKSAIHALSKSKYHAHTAPLFVKPKILNTYGVFMFHVAKFIFCFHHHLMLPSSFLLGRGGGGYLLLSHTQLPLLIFSKIPFALFVGTNHLQVYSVFVYDLRQCIRQQLFRRPCFIVLLRWFFSLLRTENDVLWSHPCHLYLSNTSVKVGALPPQFLFGGATELPYPPPPPLHRLNFGTFFFLFCSKF